MELAKVILLLLLFHLDPIIAEKIAKVKIVNLKCSFDKNNQYGNVSCFIKPNRLGELTTILFHFEPPYHEIWAQLTVDYKYTMGFRPWMVNIDEDLCSILDGKLGASRIYTIITNSIIKYVPGLLHPCPYQGWEGVRNVSISSIVNGALPHIIPSGVYRLTFRYHTKNNETFLKVELTIQFSSTDPLKNMKMGK